MCYVAKVEFLDIKRMALWEGKPLNMAELEAMFTSILQENDVADPFCSMKALKQLITSETPEAEFQRPKRMISVLMSILEKLPAKTDNCKSGGKNASLYHWCNGSSAILR